MNPLPFQIGFCMNLKPKKKREPTSNFTLITALYLMLRSLSHLSPISQICSTSTINTYITAYTKKSSTESSPNFSLNNQSMDYQLNQSEFVDMPEIDQDLLMELLTDMREEEALSLTADSIEEENDCADQLPILSSAGLLQNPDLIHAHEGCEDCSLDDMLSSLDGHECSVSSTNLVDDLLGWVDMDVGMDSPSSVIDHQWQLEGLIGCNSFYYGNGEYVEQVFCPLWE